MIYFFQLIFVSLITNSFLHAEPYYITEAARVQNKVEKRIAKELDVHIGGTGGGMMDCIYSFHTTIQTKPFTDKNQLRKLLFSIVDIYLTEINQSKKIRPHLKYYPYNEKGISIFIIGDQRTDDVIEGEIYNNLIFSRGKVIYEAINPKHQIIREETETYPGGSDEIYLINILPSNPLK